MVGAYSYLHLHSAWTMLELPQHTDMFHNARDWRPDGCLGRVGRGDLARGAAGLGVPFVNLYGSRPLHGLPQVGYDDFQIGRMAAEHLAERGFTNFAFYGLPVEGTVTERWSGFRDTLKEKGFKAGAFNPRREYPPVALQVPMVWAQSESVHRWLAWLPKPAAIFAHNDMLASWIVDACRNLGCHVPDEVSILGAENDDTFALKTAPSLSSIAVPAEVAGFEAARLLDKLMAGEKPPGSPLLFPPKGIVVRHSTDVLAVPDHRIAKAMHFIREHCCEGIGVDHVARQAGLNRRLLERLFHRYFKTSPFQMIRRRQVERVKEYLRQTDMTLAAIAEKTGFTSGMSLNTDFLKRTGTTPGTYRKQFRLQ